MFASQYSYTTHTTPLPREFRVFWTNEAPKRAFQGLRLSKKTGVCPLRWTNVSLGWVLDVTGEAKKQVVSDLKLQVS